MSIAYLNQCLKYTEHPDLFSQDESSKPFVHSYQKIHDSAINALSLSLPEIQRLQITEQLIESLIHLNKHEQANTYLSNLTRKYPLSKRVNLLRGLMLEGSPDKAIAHYRDILTSHPTCLKSQKRVIALSLPDDQINMLVEYLDIYSGDQEAWSYLSGLYESQGMFRQAIFCVEEMVLANTMLHFNFERLGRLFLEMKDVEKSLKYYLKAIELCESDKTSLKGAKRCLDMMEEKTKVHLALVDMIDMLLNRLK